MELHDLPLGHTALLFCWQAPPDAPVGTQLRPEHRIDRAFLLAGVLEGRDLNERLDVLLDEHAVGTDCCLEISVWWRHLDGRMEVSTVPACFGRYAV